MDKRYGSRRACFSPSRQRTLRPSWPTSRFRRHKTPSSRSRVRNGFLLSEIVARDLKTVGDLRAVVPDPEARYFGGLVTEYSLVPLGKARLGRIGLDNGSAGRSRQLDPRPPAEAPRAASFRCLSLPCRERETQRDGVPRWREFLDWRRVGARRGSGGKWPFHACIAPEAAFVVPGVMTTGRSTIISFATSGSSSCLSGLHS